MHYFLTSTVIYFSKQSEILCSQKWNFRYNLLHRHLTTIIDLFGVVLMFYRGIM